MLSHARNLMKSLVLYLLFYSRNQHSVKFTDG